MMEDELKAPRDTGMWGMVEAVNQFTVAVAGMAQIRAD